MNENQLNVICKKFRLGKSIKAPKRVYGGLLHVMWRLDTTEASYAIKQLSKEIDLTDATTLGNYNLTEKVASQFALKGVPSIGAIEHSGNDYVTVVEERGFLVYPWVEAKSLGRDEISQKHSLHISEILARMHKINLQIPEIQAPEFDIHTQESLQKCVEQATISQCPFAKQLKHQEKELLQANDAYQKAIAVLEKVVVVSHGDLDQKNVLWDKKGSPFLIDWECVRKLNPTYEIVNASLDWSGITTNFNKQLFINMITAYKKSGGILDKSAVEASFYGVIGNWLNWMIYNIKRSSQSEDIEQKTLGTEQVIQVLHTIQQLQRIIPVLINSVK